MSRSLYDALIAEIALLILFDGKLSAHWAVISLILVSVNRVVEYCFFRDYFLIEDNRNILKLAWLEKKMKKFKKN